MQTPNPQTNSTRDVSVGNLTSLPEVSPAAALDQLADLRAAARAYVGLGWQVVRIDALARDRGALVERINALRRDGRGL